MYPLSRDNSRDNCGKEVPPKEILRADLESACQDPPNQHHTRINHFYFCSWDCQREMFSMVEADDNRDWLKQTATKPHRLYPYRAEINFVIAAESLAAAERIYQAATEDSLTPSEPSR